MAFCLNFGSNCLDGTDLSGHDSLDLGLRFDKIVVKTVLRTADCRLLSANFFNAFDLIHIDEIFVDVR